MKERIAAFVRNASTEITHSDDKRLPRLIELLSPGTAVYIAHVPNATLESVVKTALAVQRVGLQAVPHIVARRIAYAHQLRNALKSLRDAGIDRILLIAGDVPDVAGDFESTLGILNSGILQECGVRHVGVAGYPEGSKRIGQTLLWEALKLKQQFAEKTGIDVHVVTQFGLNANAVPDWMTELARREIRLPVRVGIAGPTSLSKLIRYAMLCGIGASLRTVMRNLSAANLRAELATRPEDHLLRLLHDPIRSQVVGPHFFSFGGSLETAKWINRVAAGRFELDMEHREFRIED